MKLHNAAVAAVLFLATCHGAADWPARPRSRALALGKVPAEEVAVWQKVASSALPTARYLQAGAFDEARQVLVMFGGADVAAAPAANAELWEWSPTTGRWRQRDFANGPSARYGAALVFDVKRSRLILFGGRTNSGASLDDTWDWDPGTGVWTELGASTARPSARAQAAMVYEKSTGKILLFGGCRRERSSLGEVVVSLQDTWEYDPGTGQWQALNAAPAPSARYDAAMVWDATRKQAVLFGGMQADGVLKQDLWEWDAATGAWSERALKGSKPSARCGHAMAFDGNRGKLVLFGGQDQVYATLENDLWDWDAVSGTWTQRLTGAETGIAAPRMYASLVADDADARLLLVAGAVQGSANTQGFSPSSSHELWEIEPAQPTFTDRTIATDYPPSRYGHAMAYHPPTGKTYVFGGYNDTTNMTLGDFWAWDGQSWSRLASAPSPPARLWSAMAYDPARKSLVLYGGARLSGPRPMDDTWEWSEVTGWTQLKPASGPGGLSGHVMLTDTASNKVLLLQSTSEIWEWDGGAVTWSKRAPIIAAAELPAWGQMSYDQGRAKVFLYAGNEYGDSPSELWEWDPGTAGWLERDSGEALGDGSVSLVAYDSWRRRQIVLTADQTTSPATMQTWEVDTTAPTWYRRTLSFMPGTVHGAAMVFDAGRNVIVFFGGEPAQGGVAANDTWEYQVGNLGDGAGCTAATAATCASGNCVDGVCCATATCAGSCMACNVAGAEGRCAAALAGTEVAGSCADDLACTADGDCRRKNGLACATADDCASGFCVEGVCCDGACAGPCTACNVPGQAGRCRPYQAGTDPEAECGQGDGACRSTCDGVGACVFPQRTVACAACRACDGYGSCAMAASGSCIGGAGGNTTPGGGTTSGHGTGGVVAGGGGAGAGGRTTTILRSGGAGGTDRGGNAGNDGGAAADGGTSGLDGALLNTSTNPLGAGGNALGTGGTPGGPAGAGGTHRVGASGGTSGEDASFDAGREETAAAPADLGCSCAFGRDAHRPRSLAWLGVLALPLARRRRR